MQGLLLYLLCLGLVARLYALVYGPAQDLGEVYTVYALLLLALPLLRAPKPAALPGPRSIYAPALSAR
jgi:hypothetical protein